MLRSGVCHPSVSTSGVFPVVCIFCEQVTQSNKGKSEFLGKLQVAFGEHTIKTAALKLKDHKLLAKLGGDCLISKDVKLHHSCQKSYTNRAARLSDTTPSRKQDSEAYHLVHPYVKETLVENEGAKNSRNSVICTQML